MRQHWLVQNGECLPTLTAAGARIELAQVLEIVIMKIIRRTLGKGVTLGWPAMNCDRPCHTACYRFTLRPMTRC